MCTERLYHIVAVNDKTGKQYRQTGYPMPHHESCVMLSKILPCYRPKHIRIMLVQVGPTISKGV